MQQWDELADVFSSRGKCAKRVAGGRLQSRDAPMPELQLEDPPPESPDEADKQLDETDKLAKKLLGPQTRVSLGSSARFKGAARIGRAKFLI